MLIKPVSSPMEIKVYYEDTDCGGVVYYANYLKYFERARTEYLEIRGCSIADWMQRGVVFVVVHAEAHYYSAGRYGETLIIETDVADVTRATVTFSHVVREKLSNRIVVKGSARLAATDHHGKVRHLNKTIVIALRTVPRPSEAHISQP